MPFPPRTRYIAIDLGDKRTGLAVADGETKLVSPLTVLETPISLNNGEALIAAIRSEIRATIGTHEILELVIGLPLVREGKEGPRAKGVRKFALRIAAALANPTLHFQDESLTSVEADWSMARSGMTRGEKKSRRDALAASVILREFLANNSACQAPCQEPGVPTGPSHLQSPGLALPDQPNQPS